MSVGGTAEVVDACSSVAATTGAVWSGSVALFAPVSSSSEPSSIKGLPTGDSASATEELFGLTGTMAGVPLGNSETRHATPRGVIVTAGGLQFGLPCKRLACDVIDLLPSEV